MNINWKLRYGITAAAVGIVLLFYSLPKALSFMGDPIKVDTVAEAMMLKSGDHVLIDITMSDGYYMTYNEDGKEVARYYIATFFDTDLRVAYALTVRVGKEYYSNMEDAKKACDAFFDAFDADQSTPLPTKSFLTIDGVIEEFNNGKEKEFAKDYVSVGYMDYIYVVPNTKSASIIIIAISGAFVLIGAVLVILFFIGRKKDKERLEEMRSANPGYYQTPSNISFNNTSSGTQGQYGFNDSSAVLQNQYGFNDSSAGSQNQYGFDNSSAGSQNQYGFDNSSVEPQNPYVSDISTESDSSDQPDNNDQ